MILTDFCNAEKTTDAIPEGDGEAARPAPPKPTIVTLPKAADICKAEGIGLSYRQLRGLVMSRRLQHFKNGPRYYVSMEIIRAAVKDPNSPLWAGSSPE
jgi:hypothetical protein